MLATETSTTVSSLITDAMKTAFNDGVSVVQSDVADFVTLALPAGLAIMGLFMAIRLGIGFFRSLAN